MRTLWRELAILFTWHELWAVRIVIQDPVIGGMAFVFWVMMPSLLVFWSFSVLCIWIGLAWFDSGSTDLYFLLLTIPVWIAGFVWVFEWFVFVLGASFFQKGDGAERKRRHLAARLDRLRQSRVE